MSYDDGRVADRKLVAIFNNHGIRGTFHLNGGKFGIDDRISASEAGDLYSGHEIACHTYNHPTIERCPMELVARQILEDRMALEAICGYPVRGLSYPNGSYNEDIIQMLPHLGIEYSRFVGNTHSFGMPQNYLKWTSTCHHNKGLLDHAHEFMALYKTQYLYLFYVWGHSFEFDNDNNWNLIEEFAEYMGRHEEIWYATNIEIVDYMKACRQLRFTAAMDLVHNPAAMTVCITVNGNRLDIGPGQMVKI